MDYEILAIERMNALNAARVDLEKKFNQIGLTERQKAQQDIELARIEEKKRLVALGATQEDLNKNDAVFREQRRLLDANYAKQDASEAKSRADQRKSENDQALNDLNAYKEKVLSIQQELNSTNQSDRQNELDELRLKYVELEKEAKKAGGDLTQLRELQKQEELAIEQKYNQQILDETRKAQEEQLALLESYQIENEEAGKSAQQKELEAVGEYYFERIETLKAAGEDASNLIAEQAKKEQDIRDKYSQEAIDKARDREDVSLMADTAGLPELQQKYEIEKVELQRQYEDKIALAKQFGEDTTGLEEEFQQKQSELARQYQQERINQGLDAASNFLSQLSALNSAQAEINANKIATLDKQIENAKTAEEKKALQARRKTLESEGKKIFERNKKLQIAQALIETYKAAQGAYNSQMSLPTPDAPVRATIAAAVAVAAGLANVNKIRQTQYESGGSPGGGGGGGGSSPSFNTIGGMDAPSAPTVNPFQQMVQNRPDQITPRAFVLAGDVASATEAREKVENLARLG